MKADHYIPLSPFHIVVCIIFSTVLVDSVHEKKIFTVRIFFFQTLFSFVNYGWK